MTSTATVDTKKAARRDLHFHCTGCLREELAAIEAAGRAGRLDHTGNWTPGEILDHVAKAWEFSIDGFPRDVRIPWYFKLMARAMKGRMTSGKTLPAGFRLGKDADFFLPVPRTSLEDGLARLRKVLDRIDAGTRCTVPSPAFGAMTHDEWMRLHLGHAQLHLGFVRH
jgi:hypothetical protein